MQGQVMAFHYGDKETLLTYLSKKSYFLCNLSVMLDFLSKKHYKKTMKNPLVDYVIHYIYYQYKNNGYAVN